MSAISPFCAQCGGNLFLAGETSGTSVCVGCLLQLGLDSGVCLPLAEENRDPALPPGTKVGNYYLLQEIGAGGNGVVYLAEERESIRRLVALKIVKPGRDDREVNRRFEAERQALAQFDHPGITKIFSAGTTVSGRSWFAMEYVGGKPVTEYCDDSKATLTQRLELFLKICAAVQHAHQKGILHRDLKPGNILMADDGWPRIIDFGIAQFLFVEGGGNVADTPSQHLLGTPAFMSPEQAAQSSTLDTRTDIYSLGAVLYLLLSGVLPFEWTQIPRPPLEEILRQISETDPQSPAVRLRHLSPDQLKLIAARRRLAPKKLLAVLGGDLESIVLKCLRKNPADRYPSADALMRDVQNYLAHQPITVRPATPVYRLRKWIRRHRLAFALGSVLFVSLLAGTMVSTLLFFRQRTAARRAEIAANQSREVTRFLETVFSGVAPAVARGSDTTILRQMLRLASDRANGELKTQPAVAAEIHCTLAQAYHELGLYQPMLIEASLAFNLCRQSPEKSLPPQARALEILSDAERHLGELTSAQTHALAAVKLQMNAAQPEPLLLSGALNNLGLIFRDEQKLSEAEDCFGRAFQLDRAQLNPDHPHLATDLGHRGALKFSLNDYAGAEAAYREQLRLREKIYGPQHPELIATLNNLATVLSGEGKFALAEPLARRAVALSQGLLAADHPDAILASNRLQEIFIQTGRITSPLEKRDWVSLEPEEKNAVFPTILNNAGK